MDYPNLIFDITNFENTHQVDNVKKSKYQLVLLENYQCKEKCHSNFLNNLFLYFEEQYYNSDSELKTNKKYLKHLITNKYQSDYYFNFQKDNISPNYLTQYSLRLLCNSQYFKFFLQQKLSFQPDYFSKLVTGKKICLVGPADYDNPNYDQIDKYDLIVRVNKGTQMESTGKHGSRTDILYHVVNQHKENGGPLQIDRSYHLRFIYPILDLDQPSSFKNIGTIRDYANIYYHSKIYRSLTPTNFSIVEEAKYLQFEQVLQSRPNSGLGSIWDLLQYDIQELYITGFTLFQTNYDISYRSTVDNQLNTGQQAMNRMKQHGNHDQYKSSLYFKDYILNHPKVKYDPILEECVDYNLNI